MSWMQPLQQRNSTLGKANIVVVVVSLQALPLSPVMTNAELLPKDDIISLFGIKSHRPFHAAVVKPVNEYVPRRSSITMCDHRAPRTRAKKNQLSIDQANRHQGVNVIIYTGQQASSRWVVIHAEPRYTKEERRGRQDRQKQEGSG